MKVMVSGDKINVLNGNLEEAEMEDLISVIVPIYCVEEYLEECIQSIRNQTYKNLEIILVDDGSDDQCPQICDRHAREDERIKVIHKVNGGADSARKAGLEVACGKYVAYVDGDDWIEPEMYAKLLAYMNQYQVEIVESGVIDSYENNSKKRTPYIEEGCYIGKNFTDNVERKLLYAGVFFEHGVTPYLVTKLFLKRRVMKFQMMEGLTNVIQDDTMVSFPCIAESKKIYVLHECYYHYRVRRRSAKRECRKDEVANLMSCYSDFYARFNGTVLFEVIDKQIKYYVMYWLLYKAPYIFDKANEQEFLIPFGGLVKQSRIVLYGAGAAGIHLEAYIRSIDKCNLVCWVDRNYETLRESMDVVSPYEIVHKEYDYIVISILRATIVDSVKRDLKKIGVSEEKILWIKQEYIDNPESLLEKVNYEGKNLLETAPSQY